MKLIDEVWTADENFVRMPHGLARFKSQAKDNQSAAAAVDADNASAKLAAQAPAMARLLLANQWGGADDMERPACPECYAWVGDGHEKSCDLVAVLRAAGVIP